VDFKSKGDDYYNDPHIFCHFDFNDTPYSKIRYQVYYGGETELPTYHLEASKRTTFPK